MVAFFHRPDLVDVINSCYQRGVLLQFKNIFDQSTSTWEDTAVGQHCWYWCELCAHAHTCICTCGASRKEDYLVNAEDIAGYSWQLRTHTRILSVLPSSHTPVYSTRSSWTPDSTHSRLVHIMVDRITPYNEFSLITAVLMSTSHSEPPVTGVEKVQLHACFHCVLFQLIHPQKIITFARLI